MIRFMLRLPLFIASTFLTGCSIHLTADNFISGEKFTARDLGNAPRLNDYRVQTDNHLIGFRTNLDLEQTTQTPQTTFIIFRGGSGNIAQQWLVLLSDTLLDQGHNVILMEYPDAGLSGGTLSFNALRSSAEEFTNHLFDAGTLKTSDTVILYGLSFGSMPALHLAAQPDLMSQHDIDGLMVEGGLSSFEGMKAFYEETGHILSYLNVTFDDDIRFDNVEAITDTALPTFLIHSVDDQQIPFTMTQEMEAAAGNLIDAWYPEVGGHVAASFTNREEFLSRLARFIDHID